MRGDRLNKDRKAKLIKEGEMPYDAYPQQRPVDKNRKLNKTKRGGKRGFEN